MPLQVGFESKADSTQMTDKRLFSSVDYPVLHQRTFELERLATFSAFERPFICMHFLMREQMSGRPEALPTCGAGETSFTGVN